MPRKRKAPAPLVGQLEQHAEKLVLFRQDVRGAVSMFARLLVEHESRGLTKREMMHAYIDELCDATGVG